MHSQLRCYPFAPNSCTLHRARHAQHPTAGLRLACVELCREWDGQPGSINRMGGGRHTTTRHERCTTDRHVAVPPRVLTAGARQLVPGLVLEGEAHTQRVVRHLGAQTGRAAEWAAGRVSHEARGNQEEGTALQRGPPAFCPSPCSPSPLPRTALPAAPPSPPAPSSGTTPASSGLRGRSAKVGVSQKHYSCGVNRVCACAL